MSILLSWLWAVGDHVGNALTRIGKRFSQDLFCTFGVFAHQSEESTPSDYCGLAHSPVMRDGRGALQFQRAAQVPANNQCAFTFILSWLAARPLDWCICPIGDFRQSINVTRQKRSWINLRCAIRSIVEGMIHRNSLYCITENLSWLTI